MKYLVFFLAAFMLIAACNSGQPSKIDPVDQPPYMELIGQTPYGYLYRYKDTQTGMVIYVAERAGGGMSVTAVKP